MIVELHTAHCGSFASSENSSVVAVASDSVLWAETNSTLKKRVAMFVRRILKLCSGGSMPHTEYGGLSRRIREDGVGLCLIYVCNMLATVDQAAATWKEIYRYRDRIPSNRIVIT
jgi:hypothetical protein